MGRKEDNIRKAQAIIHNPSKIRNIGTIAHIDHGKCLHPSTKIWIDGHFVKAEDLWRRYSSGPSVPNDYGADIRDVSGESLWTRSVDFESGKTVFSQVTHIWRLLATEPLVEVETRDGRKIRTTPEHPFVVAASHKLAFREGRDLQIGDMLAVPRWLPSLKGDESWRRLEETILSRVAANQAFLFYLSTEGERRLGVKSPVRGQELLSAAKRADASLSSVYADIETIAYKSLNKRANAAAPIRLPNRESLEKAFWYLGLLYGDGDGWGCIHSTDREMLGRALNVARELTFKARLVPTEKASKLLPGTSTFVYFLNTAFGYPLRAKAHSIRLPDLLFRCPLPLAAAFVQGYLDADGTVEKSRSAVSATSVSEAFLDDLQLLLLRFGIRGILDRREKRTTLYVSGKKNLARLPQFSHPGKERRREELEARAGTSYVVDLVPVQWETLETDTWKSRFYAKAGQKPSANSLLEMVVDADLPGVDLLLNDEVAFVEVKAIREVEAEWVYDFSVPGLRNFVAEGFFVHNTTLSDSLIAGAGMMSEELAGQQLMLDFDEQEQARGITIDAAIASMVHEFEGEDHLINLIDTPGHVDFGGDVTRAMRAIDGAILVVDAVEGVMPQTETVIRQALKERVRLTLFINKVDRLINELKIGPDEMQQRFAKILTEVNRRIAGLVPDEMKKEWQVRVEDGSVAFGSALDKWAISVPFMQQTGLTFRDIYDAHREERVEELTRQAPLHRIVLNMVIRHLPDPVTAQRVRIPVIWRGPEDSEVGQSMMAVDDDGPLAFVVTKIIMDPHAGEVAAGRLFSGTMKKGKEVWISGMPNPERVQTVSMVVGPDRIPVDEITAGNVAAVVGLKTAIAGSTVSDDPDMVPFERIVHYSEPVVTVAIEAKHTKDLPRLVEVLRMIAKADPSIQIEIDQETGEHLMSGMGELHLEITQYRIVHEHGVPIEASPPIVVYRECVERRAGSFEGKSPNKHNRFYLEVQPLDDAVVDAIKSGEIPSNQRIKDSREVTAKLVELGMERDDARNIVWIQDTNIFVNATKGIQYLHETIDLCQEAFQEAMTKGPLAGERCMGVLVRLTDAKLHEDSIHRGPAQVIPATRNAIYGAMCVGNRVLLEPKQKVVLQLSQDVMGSAIAELQSRRAVIEDIEQDGTEVTINAKAPVAEMFGFATAIRSATQGRVLWNYENAGFERIPPSLQDEVVREIRERKGLKPEPFDAAHYAS